MKIYLRENNENMENCISICEDSAYINNPNVIQVKFPEGIEKIDAPSVSLRYLKEVELPSTLEWLGCSAFEGCISLTEITLPENCYHIGPTAFYRCKKLKRVNILCDYADYGEAAFEGCSDGLIVTYKGVDLTLEDIEDYYTIAKDKCTDDEYYDQVEFDDVIKYVNTRAAAKKQDEDDEAEYGQQKEVAGDFDYGFD